MIKYYKQQGCEILFKMNDKMDIAIAFIHNHKVSKASTVRHMKELIIIKKDSTGIRQAYKVRVNALKTDTIK